MWCFPHGEVRQARGKGYKKERREFKLAIIKTRINANYYRFNLNFAIIGVNPRY